jgi:hypothetical protein
VARLWRGCYNLETSTRHLQEIRIFNDKDGKALIERVISRLPILALGNSDGD